MITLAVKEDIDNLLCWRNDPEMVRLSTSQRRVEWSEHCRWFESVLLEIDTLVFIIRHDLAKNDCGYVRLTQEENQAVISIFLIAGYRGKGIGISAINAAVRYAFKRWDIKKVIAYIREENESSINVFKKAGFYVEIGECPEGHLVMVTM